MSIVEVKNYTKILKKKKVLNDVSITFDSGHIYGLYGRNGSGKTMMLRAISGLIFPTSGSVTIDGKVLHQDMSFPDSIGVIIENTNLLPQYSAYTNLKLLAKIRNSADDGDIFEAIRKVGLDPEDKRNVKVYSLGMKQKLSIAQAIFEKPDVLLLDEPTNALDQESIAIVRSVLMEMKEKGCTIIIASHHRDDLEYLCDEIYYMNDGILHTDAGSNEYLPKPKRREAAFE